MRIVVRYAPSDVEPAATRVRLQVRDDEFSVRSVGELMPHLAPIDSEALALEYSALLRILGVPEAPGRVLLGPRDPRRWVPDAPEAGVFLAEDAIRWGIPETAVAVRARDGFIVTSPILTLEPMPCLSPPAVVLLEERIGNDGSYAWSLASVLDRDPPRHVSISRRR